MPITRGGVEPAVTLRVSTVKSWYAHNHRDDKNRHQRKNFYRGFQRTADDHSPSASGEVLDHEKGHAAKADAKPEHESQKIRMEELDARVGKNCQTQRHHAK